MGSCQCTRLVLLTAHDRKEVSERALAAGFSACLVNPAASLGSGPRPLILLAEDNLTNQKVAQLQLDRMGYAVQTVGDGAPAVAAVDAQNRQRSAHPKAPRAQAYDQRTGVDDRKNPPEHEPLTPRIHNSQKPDSGNFQKRSCFVFVIKTII
jgi:CheY-like chemotaxis protein